MFMSGVKKLFVILGLVLMSSLAFVGCKEESYSVNSIAYNENEKIVMVVGATYQPGVTVLPSYASNKGYHFEIDANSGVIAIKGKSIVAMKEGVAQLKLVADDNENLNDAITVEVLASPIKLDAPTNLKFEGDSFSFSPVNNATSYILDINGTQIELVGKTICSLSEYQRQAGVVPYDKILNAKVMAKGDNSITIPSSYCETLSVLKISTPTSLKIDQGILSFSAIPGVKYYTVKVFKDNETIINYSIDADSIVANIVKFNLLTYSSLLTGGEYRCELVCDDTKYGVLEGVDVFPSDSISYAFEVLSMPKNFKIIHNVLYWDKVAGADSYTLLSGNDEVVQAGIVNNYYDISSLIEDSKTYYFKLVAVSQNKNSVISGINYSNVVNFKVLTAPSVSLDLAGKKVVWDSVEGATSYRVTIKKNGEEISSNLYANSSYDVSNLDSGRYTFVVSSCGNGTTSLNSTLTKAISFVAQDEVQNLRIENKKILWSAEDDTEFNLVIKDLGGNELANVNQTLREFDLTNYTFSAGQYYYSVKCVEGENKLASKINTQTFYKLEEVSALELNGEELTFSIGLKTVSTKVEYYKVGDETNIHTMTKVEPNKYTINGESLTVGEYVVHAYAYGNTSNIFDAENTESKITITKLDVPTIAIDSVNMAVKLTNNVVLAESYELYQNGEVVENFSSSINSYSLKSLTAGSFEYKIKSVSSQKNIVNSNISSQSLKVLRLKTPTIDFDKQTMEFKVNTSEQDYVDSCNFKLNGNAITATKETNKWVADCSSEIVNPIKYTAQTYLIAKTSHANYDLILDSVSASLEVTKINPTASMTLSNGELTIQPNSFTADSSYLPTLIISYKSGEDYVDVEYNNLSLDGNAYKVNIIDENHLPIGPTTDGNQAVFGLSNEFRIKWKLSNTDLKTVDSDIEEISTITKRDKVENLSRVGSVFKFDAVAGATKYLLNIKTDKDYYVEVDTNSIDIENIVALFETQGLNIEAGIQYEIKVVALGNDSARILPSVSEDALTFKLLLEPTATIKEDANYGKIVNIPCNINGAEKFVLVFSDKNGNSTAPTSLVVNGETSLNYALSNVIGLDSGNITISIKAINETGNYFDSSEFILSYEQLDTPSVTVENGKVVWDNSSVAESYILYYYQGVWKTKSLNTSDFELNDDKIIYEIGEIEGGLSKLKVKAVAQLTDGEKYYYDSQDSAIIDVLKLSKPTTTISNGEIVVSLTDDIKYIEKLVITNLQTNEEIDITSIVDSLSSNMTIVPDKLLQYISETEILDEKFEFNVIAKNYGESVDKYCLNSNAMVSTFAGLKPVNDIEIKLSTNYDADGETIDKISWTNNDNNSSITKGYSIYIKHTNEETEIEKTYLVEGGNISVFTFPREAEFKAGNYVVKIKALAIINDKLVNAPYGNEFSFSVTNTPENLTTTGGLVSWDNVQGQAHYIVRVYDKDNTYLDYKKVDSNIFDFNSLNVDLNEGLYYVTVQAINESDPTVVSSRESEPFGVVRLPKIAKYKLDMGNLYVYAHSFTSKIKLTLTSSDNVYEFSSILMSSAETLTGDDWADVVNLDDILTSENNADEHKFDYVQFVVDFSATQYTYILDCISNGYTLSLQAIGNSSDSFATVNSAQTNSTSGKGLINDNLNTTSDAEENIQRSVVKTLAPTTYINERGRVDWELVDTSYSNMDYNGLTGLLLYNINVSVKGQDYAFLVADNVDINNLPANTTLTVFQELDTHTYYGYLRYDNGTTDNTDDLIINVVRYVDGTDNGSRLRLDFAREKLHYATLKADGSVEMKTISIVDGGSFDIAINVLGDSTIYLTSNKCKSTGIVRYQQIVLDIEDGYLKWLNLKTEADSPIYLLTITNKSNVADVKLIYLYEEGVGEGFKIPVTIEGKTYMHGISYDTAYIKYELNKLVDSAYVVGAGNYAINLTTYYRDNTSLNTLQSKPSADYGATKLEQTTLSLSKGELKWKLINYNTNDAVYNYEITVETGAGLVKFRVDNTNYTIKNETTGSYIYYSLPEKVIDVDSNEFSFTEGENYTFYVKALAGTNESYINANDSMALNANINTTVTNVHMEGNNVVWEYAEAGSYMVQLSYYIDETTLITCVSTTTNKYFTLPIDSQDSKTKMEDITGVMRELTSAYTYSICVKRIGGNSVISSFYCEPISTEKLKTINTSEIFTNQGVLTWTPATNIAGEMIEGAKYLLQFTNDVYDINGELVASVIADNANFDFAGYQDGEIKFTICAMHDNFFNSYTSNIVTLYKLGIITNFKPEKDDNNVLNTLTWSAVTINGEFADKYLVEVYHPEDKTSPLFNAEYLVEDKSLTTIRYNISGVGITLEEMLIRVKAVSINENSNIVNGEWSEFYALTKANEVNGENFKFDETNQTITWHQIDNEQSNDSYVLQYSYTAKGATSVDESVTFNVNDENNFTTIILEDDTTVKVYQYRLYKVGTYANFRVIVNRADIMSSNPVYLTLDGSAESARLSYNFDLFDNGDGKTNPYVITTNKHFENINLFNSANYILNNNLTLSGSVNVIVDSFSGSLNGNNKTISSSNSNLRFNLASTSNIMGIFGELNGATISNLTITYANASIITAYSGDKVYGGILAGKAINSTLQNIIIEHSSISATITDDSMNYSNANSIFYIGGLVGYLENSSLISCNITLIEAEDSLSITGQTRDYFYFGGVAGYGLNSTISGTSNESMTIALNYSTNVTIAKGFTMSPNVYIGGILGYFSAKTKDEGIQYVTVAITQTSASGDILFNAGACGEIAQGTIDNVVVTGNIGANWGANSFNSIYLGKLVAKLSSNVLLSNNIDGITLSYNGDKVVLVEICENI